ncbi:VOC family protein [Micromonospora sp. WMMD1076]|uniref:VOC family protein n=1 Tax=Micromonospora TaxID=1873 RepID=UPI00249B9619|nr:VOC family protein [Micromonospora sp. WMMD1076]WFF05903.1 VOC family protein [Micromonospora sp. WMMD1076]
MATIHDVVVESRHPASLARFWAAALDGYAVAPYDEEELARLAGTGVLDPEDDPTVLVEAAPGVRPRFFFVLQPEPKTTKNRVHLDLHAEDRPGEVARLVALGASVLGEHDGWTVLADPEGNELCVRD